MNVISLKGSDILSKYHGESAVKLREYFDKARELAPSMVIIDELDVITASRDSNNNGAGLVNELLAQLDGYDELTDVLVVGTTNYRERIDQAVLRYGRFDIKLTVPYPDKNGIRHLLKYYLNRSGLAYDKNILSYSFECLKSEADVENAVNHAVFEAM